MVAIRTFAPVAALAVGIAAEVVHGHAGHLDHHAEPAALSPREESCVAPPTLCTGQVEMFGYATTLTYLCTDAGAPTTIHVTVTATTTITPTVTPVATVSATDAVPAVGSAPIPSDELITTVKATSTTTMTTTITLVANTDITTAPAVPITDKFSVTIPTELLTKPTVNAGPSASESRFTVQTSTPKSRFTVQTTTPTVTQSRFTVQTTTPILTTGFPSLTLPVENGTTSGIFYTHSINNSSVVMLNSSMIMTDSTIYIPRPTPIHHNTTAGQHYDTPTLKVAQAAATDVEQFGAASGDLVKDVKVMMGLVGGLMMAVFLV